MTQAQSTTKVLKELVVDYLLMSFSSFRFISVVKLIRLTLDYAVNKLRYVPIRFG